MRAPSSMRRRRKKSEKRLKTGVITTQNSVLSGAPTPQELELINNYTVKPLSADEVYTFGIVLCDNEIDRDFERFDIPALEKLAELFVGKTGIFDHSMSGRDQTARIFSCRVETDENKVTSAGEKYTKLCAKAYMPRSKKEPPHLKGRRGDKERDECRLLGRQKRLLNLRQGRANRSVRPHKGQGVRRQALPQDTLRPDGRL